MKLHAILTHEAGSDVYVAQGVEVDVASQGATEEEALRNLAEAIELYFDDEDSLPVPTPVADVELRQVDIRLAS